MLEMLVVVFVMATGFIATTIVLSLAFWYTQRIGPYYPSVNLSGFGVPNFQVKYVPYAVTPSPPIQMQPRYQTPEPIRLKAVPTMKSASVVKKRRRTRQ